MDTPILSIAIIAYNQEKYIREAIEGVINQKHDYKYELIISDDCSTDSTAQIIKEYEEKYPDIIVGIYNEKNLGAMKNYYNALKRCKGKYIMVCGGDDYFLDGKIKKQLDYLEKHHDVGMVYGLAKTYNEKNNKFERRLFGIKNVTYNDLMKNRKQYICAASVCFRRSLFFEYYYRVKPDERGWMVEDYPFWIWVSYKSKLAFIDEVFVVYRKISGSLSHGNNLEKKLAYERAFYEMMYYFTIDDMMRAKVRSDYFWGLSCVFYDFDLFDEAKYYAKKCDWSMIPIETKIKFISLYFPGIRYLLSRIYKKWYGIV